MNNLYEQLKKYGQSEIYPFHMPGHKRNIKKMPEYSSYGIDITEVNGFDNLHEANGILSQAMKRAAKLRGADESFFLINGSTCGLLSAISAVTNHRDEILIARNCHKAVYHGIFLNELNARYIYPQKEEVFGLNCGISSAEIRELLIKYPKIRSVLITSPTYEGVVSDVAAIAKVVHEFGIPLIVDQAHGAHFGICEQFPQSAVKQEADIVIESVHKTLPAYTQTALLHVNGTLVNREKLKSYLSIFQTSSPSYILMSGIDWCMEWIEREGRECFQLYRKELDRFYEKRKQLRNLIFWTPSEEMYREKKVYDFDPSKLVIGSHKITGAKLHEIFLTKYQLQMEMAAGNYVLAMTSPFDTEEGFIRLLKACKEIDRELDRESEVDVQEKISERKRKEPEQVFSSYEVSQMEGKVISLEDSIGRISKEFIYLYPPGIPLLVPGERINAEVLQCILKDKKNGLEIHGLKDSMNRNIEIVE